MPSITIERWWSTGPWRSNAGTRVVRTRDEFLLVLGSFDLCLERFLDLSSSMAAKVIEIVFVSCGSVHLLEALVRAQAGCGGT